MRRAGWIALVFLLAPLMASAETGTPGSVDDLFNEGCNNPVSMAPAEPAVLADLDLFAPEAQSAQLPLCPNPTNCPGGCPPSPNCLVGAIGQCCMTPAGAVKCCLPGKVITVKVCPCQGCPAGTNQVSAACV